MTTNKPREVKRFDIYDRIAVGEISEGTDGDYVLYTIKAECKEVK